MPGIACLQQRNVPRALTANVLPDLERGLGRVRRRADPATLTSTSRSAAAGATCASSRTSSRCARAFGPSSPASCSTASRERSARRTCAPAAASVRATAAPIGTGAGDECRAAGHVHANLCRWRSRSLLGRCWVKDRLADAAAQRLLWVDIEAGSLHLDPAVTTIARSRSAIASAPPDRERWRPGRARRSACCRRPRRRLGADAGRAPARPGAAAQRRSLRPAGRFWVGSMALDYAPNGAPSTATRRTAASTAWSRPSRSRTASAGPRTGRRCIHRSMGLPGRSLRFRRRHRRDRRPAPLHRDRARRRHPRRARSRRRRRRLGRALGRGSIRRYARATAL